MKEISEYLTEHHIESMKEAVLTFEDRLANLERELASRLLVDFPLRNKLEDIAESLLENIESEVVKVNSVGPTKQVTVASAPHELRTTIPVEDSLCFMTVGSGEPLSVSDIANDVMLEGHDTQGTWGSWASAPIVIKGLEAGAVCALESNSRMWTETDEKLLQATARSIAAEVEAWLNRKAADNA